MIFVNVALRYLLRYQDILQVIILKFS